VWLGVAFSALLLVAIDIQFRFTDWHMGRTESSSLALARLRQQDDLTGAALLGVEVTSGNYFYLRRNVPYIVRGKWNEITTDASWKCRDINYVIAHYLPEIPDTKLEVIETVKELSIIRVRHVPRSYVETTNTP
jgi:hypothetical protein